MLAIDTAPHMQYRLGDKNACISAMFSDDITQQVKIVRRLSIQTKGAGLAVQSNQLLHSIIRKKFCLIELNGHHQDLAIECDK
jgi:hypothetical protein